MATMPFLLRPSCVLSRAFLGASACVAALCLSGCASTGEAKASVYQSESFDSETFSRNFAFNPGKTCEAARRALLSQGYVVERATSESIRGSKNFQPRGEVHVQLQINVVCAPATPSGKESVVFVSALQDRYSLRKSNNSATLGVSAIGSVSLPVTSSDDSLVKVGSETVPAGRFYERFFSLLDRFLKPQETIAENVDPHTLDNGASAPQTMEEGAAR